MIAALRKTELRARLEFFSQRIYPALSAAGIQDEKDLNAVPILLGYCDQEADKLWNHLFEAYEAFHGRSHCEKM